MIEKHEFSLAMETWEKKGKCQFTCRGWRNEIYSLASGVDEDLDKKITWNEFLSAVRSKRMTENDVMVQVR